MPTFPRERSWAKQQTYTWLWAVCSSSNLQQKSLALAASKALQNILLHILIPALSLWFGQMAPRGQGCNFVCPTPAFFTVITLKVIIVLFCLITEQKSFWRCQSKGPGAEVMWMHITYTYIWLFLLPRFVDPLVFIKDEMIGRADFYLTNVLILLTCPQVYKPLGQPSPPPPTHLPRAQMPKQTW